MPVNHRTRRDVFFCGTGISKLLKTPAAASIVAMTNTTVMMILFIFQHPSFLLRIDSIIIIGSSQGRTEKKALHPRKSGAYVFPSVKNQLFLPVIFGMLNPGAALKAVAFAFPDVF